MAKKRKRGIAKLKKEIMERTPHSLENILFFDGTNIDEVKFLFTRNQGKRKRLKRFNTVVRELSLLKKPKLVNKVKKRLYLKEEKIHPKNINRVPIAFDEERRPFTRPPANYSNISREDRINQILAL